MRLIKDGVVGFVSMSAALAVFGAISARAAMLSHEVPPHLISPMIPDSTQTVDGVTWRYRTANGRVELGGDVWHGESPIAADSEDGIAVVPDKLVIPSQLGGNPVRGIRSGSFDNFTNLTSVTIPEGLTYIESYSFYRCTALSEISFPDSLMQVGTLAFGETPWLESQPTGLVRAGKVVLGLKGECPETIMLPTDVKGIAGSAFMGIDFDDDGAFARCGDLKAIEMPDSVEIIGNYAFSYCTGLVSVTLPTSLSFLGERAFEHCSSLTSVTIPSGVSWMGYSVFERCSALTNVVIAEGVEWISEAAFSYCPSLKEIELPASVKCIEGGAFSETGLTNVVFRGGPPEAAESAFGYDMTNVVGVYQTQRTAWESVISNGTWRGLKMVYRPNSSVEDGDPLSLLTSDLPPAMEKVAYEAQLVATNGTLPYAWSLRWHDYSRYSDDGSFKEVGTAQGWRADDACWELDLPFDFPFYDSTYRKVYVSSNGTLAFDGYLDEYSASVETFTNRAMVAVLWNDLQTTEGDIYVAESADSVTIRWKGVYFGGTPHMVDTNSVVSVSATLFRDGTIRLSYFDGTTSEGRVGVSSGDGERFNGCGEIFFVGAGETDIVFRRVRGLPEGLALSDDGRISGVPITAGTNTFTVIVTDATGETAKAEQTIVVKPNPNQRPVIEEVFPTTNVVFKAGEWAAFSATAYDPEGVDLVYTWTLDGSVMGVTTNEEHFAFRTHQAQGGAAHTLTCFVSDGFWTNEVRHAWSFRVVRDWYVDASVAEDGDGLSSDSALASLDDAIALSADGDTIYVAPGTYEMQYWFDECPISVVATEGPSQTFLQGEFYGGAEKAWLFKGFTLKGFDAYGISLQDCILTGDEDGKSSRANRCRLENCLVTGNRSGWDILESCEVVRCTLAGNVVRQYGVICSGYEEEPGIVRESIVWGNVTAGGDLSNYDRETWAEEGDGTNETVRAYVRFENSCTWPMPLEVANAGNITNDPWLVDVANGDLRLRVGSPCLDANGVQTMGARLGDPVEGYVLSVRIDGNGGVSPLTAVVPAGGSATFVVTNAVRPFLGFSTNGVFATADETLTWPNVMADGIVTAAFSNFTFHVDAATGNDANDGRSWASPKASIQSAIDETRRGETILVKPGTYAPIVTEGHPALRIVGIEGKAVTLIDGGGTNACARLEGSESLLDDSTLVGFTITNGYSSAAMSSCGVGGGVSDGRIEDCDVIDCSAMGFGGGIVETTAIRCRILGNSVAGSLGAGGVYSSMLINCLVADNESRGSHSFVGGASWSTLHNCTVVGNSVVGFGTGGVSGCNLYNTIVYDNSSVTGASVRVASDINSLEDQANCWIGTDPGFVDVANGDYRLASGSPCIDAGANSFVQGSTDLAGNPRLVNGMVDIGCYEWAAVAVPQKWYVDASAAEGGDGTSAESALSSLDAVIPLARDGDTIYVAPGTYRFEGGVTNDVAIVAQKGPGQTTLCGAVFNGPLYPGDVSHGDASHDVTFSGFTVKDFYAERNVTFKDCVLTGGEDRTALVCCHLEDCLVTGIHSGGLFGCSLVRCTVARNVSDGLNGVCDSYNGKASDIRDSIVWGNVTSDGMVANYRTGTWTNRWAETANDVERAHVRFENSCTWPMPLEVANSGNITNDPYLVDFANGDLRLRVGSPCLDANGVQTMGARLGDPVAGYVLSVRVEGKGSVSPLTAVVSAGGSATFAVTNAVRPFLGFSTNGVFATVDETLTWPNVMADGIVTAAFSNFTFHVDAATGNDANDGLGWNTAKRTIQAAIEDALDGETILVKPGVYSPISAAAANLRIESTSGKSMTTIDGGGTNRCAYLGRGGIDPKATTLRGFTLTNGYEKYYGGGGAFGGELEDCDVVGNVAGWGGGLYHATAIRCRILGNRATLLSSSYGGGAYGGRLISCLVASNEAGSSSSSYSQGGGVYGGALFNCTVVGNRVLGSPEAECNGGGFYTGSYQNTIICGNTVTNVTNDVGYSDGTVSGFVGGDPQFVDAANGDYRLASGSPCIDAGSNSFVQGDRDLAGNPRIVNGTVDIGCYEWQNVPVAPLPDLTASAELIEPQAAVWWPGDTVTVRVVTHNVGTTNALAPWRNRLSLVNDSGARATLLTWLNETNLSEGDCVTNLVTCAIPELVPLAGNSLSLSVTLDMDDAVEESDDEANNVCCIPLSEVSLGKCLYLSAASAEIKENVASGVRFTVRRSGPVDAALSVTVGATDAASLSVPATVTIPAGSVSTIFTGTPVDNSIVDGTRLVPVSVSADGFRGAFVPLTILDDEVPRLSVSLSQTSIREGDGVIIVTVTREGARDEPLTVYLNGGSSRVSLPASVVIPAGEKSVTFEIAVPDNDTAQVAANLTLRASAAGYASASADYTVEDDDVPGVTLTLSPETVSEGAGARAVYATLTRSDTNHIAQVVRVRLTASEANQLILPGEVTIPTYTMSVRFAIGVVDNARNDGDREVTVNGAVVIESCGCDGQPSNGDVIQATLGIIDNDGPALALVADPATMREGLSPAGYLTLSHNSTLAEDLTVRLWVDEANADEISLPETVTIPAGETSVRIPVTTLDDGVEDGGQLVSVYAEDAAGVFAAASTWIQVSDQNLPDLQVASVETVQTVISKESLSVSFVVTNVGFMGRSGAIPYAVHLVKGANGGAVSSATLVKSGTLTGDLAVNGSLSGAVQVTAPELPGDYRVAVVLDPDGTISELDAANNTGWSAAFAVGAAYTATAGVDGDKVCLPGATVMITGLVTRADGTVAANVPVDVYVMVNGLRRTLSAESGADGHYSVSFVPTSGEAGDYTVGATYPGVESSVAQDGFSILGMKRASTANVIWDFALGDTETRTVQLVNRSAVPLTGVTVSLHDVPTACKLDFDIPETLPANGRVALSLTATAVGVTEQVDYEKFAVRIETAEGVSLEIPLYFHAQTQQACLRATPAKIDTTMAVGATRYLDVTILNDGKGDSGALSASVPDVPWLKIMAGASVANLASGESAVVTLALTPTEADGLTLNSPLAGGQLVINCANGKGCSVPLRFTPVSEATGRVCVDVVDNNTYYLESRPHLSNATVKVSNPYTGAVVATGLTGEDGIWTADGIPEGTYQLTIAAANHETYADRLVIEPGKEAQVTAFLQYRLVTATWDVKKTEIEDSYDIDLVLEFETQVPAPIVKTTMPKELPTLAEGESYAFTITLANEGVIAADKVTLTMPEIEGYTFTLSDNEVAVPAKSSVTIAAVFSRPVSAKSQAASLLRAASKTTSVTVTMCRYYTHTKVFYRCGPDGRLYSYRQEVRHGECETERFVIPDDNEDEPGDPPKDKDPKRTPQEGSIGPGGPGGFGGGGGTYTKRDCDVKKTNLRLALQNCKAAWNDVIDYMNEVLERENIGDSDCIGNHSPLTAESKTPSAADKALGDLMRDAYARSSDPNDEHYDADLAKYPIDVSSLGYERLNETELVDLLGAEAFSDNALVITGEGVVECRDGLKARLYKSGNGSGDYVLAFAGSEANAKDWLANILNFACMTPSQYKNAARLLTRLLARTSGKVKVVGHSLGGGLTQYAMLSNNLNGRVSGMTYNATGICRSVVPTLKSCEEVAANIVNYRAKNDPVSVYGNLVGPVYNIPTASGHSSVYFGTHAPTTPQGWDDGWSLASGNAYGAYYFGGSKYEGLHDNYARAKYGVAAFVEMKTCRTALLSILGDDADFPWAEIMAGAETGELKKALSSFVKNKIENKIEEAAMELELSQLGLTMDLKRKAEYLGSAYYSSVADEIFGAKEVYGLLEEASVDTRRSAVDEWLELTDVETGDFIIAALPCATNWNFEAVRQVAPSHVSDEAVAAFISRMEVLAKSIDVGTVKDELEACERATRVLKGIRSYAREQGYSTAKEMWQAALKTLEDYVADSSDAVCASVTLKLSQTMAMTREAFDGTLTLYNGNTTTPISDLKMDVSVLDEDGNECKDLFEIFANGTSGAMSEGSALDGGLSVAANGTGSAMIRFIPARQAAPTEPKLYRFGGTIVYTDPFSGETATVKLVPVALTVSPAPYLHLDYFVQRDVCADNPLTPDVVEASLPAELAVLVRNVGGGAAKGVTIASAVPETVLNEKGLSVAFDLKDYTLEASALNGATAHLGLNTVLLGTVAPNESKVAQWWLTSSIEGHFVGMSATVTPVNSWNTPDTTLVDPSVGVHKLIRSVVADGDSLPDFLVCDSADLYGRPDVIYTATGDILPVAAASVATSATLPAGREVALSVTLTPAQPGWNYGSAVLPGVTNATVTRVVRTDGSEVPLRNVWITDRTFRDGTTPLREDRLHIVDDCTSAAARTYTVTLEAKSTDVPEVASFEGVTDGGVEYAARDAVTVTFTKPIEVATFTTDDLNLTKQGEYVHDLSALTIMAADDTGTRFTIGSLAALCSDYGRYELTVQCAGIADAHGNLGRVGKSVAWTFAPEGSEAPQLSALARVASDGFGGETFLASFDRAVVSTCVTLANWTLRRNGSSVSWPTSAQVVARNAAEYALSGIDGALDEEGVYELTFSATGVSDAAGHTVTGEKTISWTVDRTPPACVSDLAISPDGGFSDSDGITWTRELTVSGTLPEDGLTVEILCRYVGGGETLLATLAADATSASLPFSQAIVLPGVGNVTLVVRLTDAAGNSSDTEKSVFVDALALTGTLSGAPTDSAVVASTVTLTFSDHVMDGDVTLERFTLVRDGEAIALEGVSLSKVDDVTFTLTGLDALCAEDGAYVLRFDGSAVRKYLSGLTMGGALALRWRYEKPDRVPPTVTAVLFDGEEPHAAYTNVFSTIAVTFSEAVNVPTLIENGLIGRAARIDLLDAANVATGSAAVVQAAMWDARGNTLTWAINPATVPVGRARLTLEAGLISDLVGNRLSADGFPSVDGLRAYAPTERKLAQVNAQAMPCWHDGTLYVGERTTDGVGKIRRYAAGGTWSYLQSDGADIEIPSEGCQGASVAFADTDGDGEAEIYVGTADGRVLKYPGGEEIGLPLANGRAMPFAVDLNGDGRDELIVGGLDGHIRVLSRRVVGGMWVFEAQDLLDSTGFSLKVPNGRAAPVVVDINHDGFPDILSGDTAGNIWAFLGEGSTWCAQPVAVFANMGDVADRSRLGVGDVDGDGVTDLVVGRSDGSVTLLRGVERPTPSVTFEVCAFTLAMSVNAEDLEWTTGGAAEWQPVWDGHAYDGQHCAQSGVMGNDTNAWIETTVEGAGVLSFAWRCSTEARYDMCQLLVDGEVKGVISGETPWTTNVVSLVGGTHTVRWNYRKSRSGAAGEDRVWLDAVSWSPEVPLTLAEALNPDLFWETKGDVAWKAVRKQSVLEPRDGWAVAEGLSDYGFSSLETLVYGAGTLTFDWAVSCEDGYDWFDFLVDGEVRASITGETAWKTVTVEFADAGRHALKWEYWKDDMDEAGHAGENRAKLDNVIWTPLSADSQWTTTTPDPIPFDVIRTDYPDFWKAAKGDYEAAAHLFGRNGYAIWQSYVAGLNPDEEGSRFKAKIEMADGQPVVTWEPDTPELRATRTYTTYGKKTLLDRDWTPVTDANRGDYNFFKVEVRMKR